MIDTGDESNVHVFGMFQEYSLVDFIIIGDPNAGPNPLRADLHHPSITCYNSVLPVTIFQVHSRMKIACFFRLLGYLPLMSQLSVVRSQSQEAPGRLCNSITSVFSHPLCSPGGLLRDDFGPQDATK